uniref:hypothetical protein n=1 Tax=Candidatus Frankia alpina TaxID=2699483 RepID=UPI0019676B78
FQAAVAMMISVLDQRNVADTQRQTTGPEPPTRRHAAEAGSQNAPGLFAIKPLGGFPWGTGESWVRGGPI